MPATKGLIVKGIGVAEGKAIFDMVRRDQRITAAQVRRNLVEIGFSAKTLPKAESISVWITKSKARVFGPGHPPKIPRKMQSDIRDITKDAPKTPGTIRKELAGRGWDYKDIPNSVKMRSWLRSQGIVIKPGKDVATSENRDATTNAAQYYDPKLAPRLMLWLESFEPMYDSPVSTTRSAPGGKGKPNTEVTTEKMVRMANPPPDLWGYCRKTLGLTKYRVELLATFYPDIQEVVDLWHQICETTIITNALMNKYNAYFAALYLFNKHGWMLKHKQEDRQPVGENKYSRLTEEELDKEIRDRVAALGANLVPFRTKDGTNG